jgi:ABC-type phosphate transport system auxiliary subunit
MTARDKALKNYRTSRQQLRDFEKALKDVQAQIAEVEKQLSPLRVQERQLQLNANNTSDYLRSVYTECVQTHRISVDELNADIQAEQDA